MAWSSARGGWLPRSTWEDTSLAVDGSGHVVEVRAADILVRSEPRGDPIATPRLLRETRVDVPAQRVASLPDGRVVGPARAVVDAHGTLLNGYVRYFGTTRARQHPVFLHPGIGAPTRISGDLVVLASRGDGNYYHFLHDVLPRILTAERSGLVTPTARWYVPGTSGFQRELVAAMLLESESIVDADAQPHVVADRLVVPTLPDLDLGHPSWSTQFLRERLLPEGVAAEPGRRLYVTRGRAPHNRIVRNEGAVLDMLGDRGFEAVDPGRLSVREQIEAFATAELVVAPHGAALANITFCSPGSSLVELFAPGYVQGCYWKLSTTVRGLTYRYVVGRGRRVGRWSDGMGVSADIDVEVSTLADVVDGLIKP